MWVMRVFILFRSVSCTVTYNDTSETDSCKHSSRAALPAKWSTHMAYFTLLGLDHWHQLATGHETRA